MREAGFSEANGFSPEVVDAYVETANALAHIEVKRFLSIVRADLTSRKRRTWLLTAITVMIEFFGLPE